MLSEETAPNEKRRSLTFADKFEVKFFFKAEAPIEVAFCETSFTTGSESYYEDDDYWDSYDEEGYYDDDGQYNDDYYDEDYDDDDYDYNDDQDMYYQRQRDYHSYTTSEYDDYYHYDYDYCNNGTSFSLRYTPDESYDHHYNEEEEEEIRGRRRTLFDVFRNDDENYNDQNANERSNTRRLALAKLEKGLFRRQHQRDTETFSETEESEASNSNSESDPFDEPLPIRSSANDFFNDLKHSNSSVTVKATFTSRNVPLAIPIPNRNPYNVVKHDIQISHSYDQWKKNNFDFNDLSKRFRPSSLSILDTEENPFSSLEDTLLSCTPLTIINKSPLRVNLSTTKDHVKDLLKSPVTNTTTTTTSSFTKIKPINSNDLVKTMTNNSLLSHKKSAKETTTTANIDHLLSNIHNNTNSKGTNNKGIKTRSRSYSSPSSFQPIVTCF